MIRTAKLLNTPSIHNIIVEDQNIKLNNQIKQFFKSQSYPTFPLNDLISLNNYSSDQRFYILVKQLQDWNKKVQSNQVTKDSKAQLYRNKFLFTSLKNIVINGSKGAINYQQNLNKLYQWWRKNSKQQLPMYFTTRKKTKQDQDWQIRKTFKSNMPLQLRNYQRRALFTTQQELSYLHTSKGKQLTQQKLVDYSAIKQFNSKQLKRRQARQQEQIQYCKTLLKSKKSRFQQNHCHNFQLYKGNFNLASKTSTMFYGRRSQKSALKQNNYSRTRQNNRLKNSCSFSLLDRQKQQLMKIKKYRFNSALARKGLLFQQRDNNINKTTKTFLMTKPFDSTISDFGQTMMTARKQTLTKHLSIKVDDIPGPQSKQNIKNIQLINIHNKQQIKQQEYTQFMQVKNWDGDRLMSNPFEKKKLLKKKKKK